MSVCTAVRVCLASRLGRGGRRQTGESLRLLCIFVMQGGVCGHIDSRPWQCFIDRPPLKLITLGHPRRRICVTIKKILKCDVCSTLFSHIVIHFCACFKNPRRRPSNAQITWHLVTDFSRCPEYLKKNHCNADTTHPSPSESSRTLALTVCC